LIAFSGVINKILTADPLYIPKYPSAAYVFRNASNLYNNLTEKIKTL
jgi:hypothetical protein